MPGYTVGILAAGTRAGRGQDGARQRRGRRRRDQGPDRAVQRGRREAGRGLLRRAAGGDGPAAGAAGPPGRLGSGQPARAGDGRAALPAAGRRGEPCCPAASGAGWRCAGCCCPSRTCCCWTSRPTTWTPRASRGWSSTWTKYPGTVVAVTHDRYFLDNVAGWILELDRGHAYPYEGNYSTYLETKAARMKVEGQRDAKLRRRLEQELEWVRSSPRARQAKSRARLDRYEQMAAEAASRQQAGLRGDPDPARSAAGQPGGRGQRPGQGVRRPDADRRS